MQKSLESGSVLMNSFWAWLGWGFEFLAVLAYVFGLLNLNLDFSATYIGV